MVPYVSCSTCEFPPLFCFWHWCNVVVQVETLQRLLASERPSAPSAAAVAEATATQAALAKEYLQDCQAALDVASELQEQRNYWKKRVGM